MACGGFDTKEKKHFVRGVAWGGFDSKENTLVRDVCEQGFLTEHMAECV